MLARSFHVRKNNERVLNARSVRNEQNVPNVRSNYDQHHGAQCFNACNSLPDAVVSSRSAAVFKRNLQSVDFPAVAI